jgi:RNA polymerase sigma factor (sigma-70 family)
MTSNLKKTGISTWLDNAARFPLLPVDRVLSIAKQIQALEEDDPKRHKLVGTLVNHNLRLVPRFVRAFMENSHNKWGSPETCDYLQVGAIGLQRAAQRFDPERGYSFSTYANHWIRSTVSRYNMKTISPVYVSESISRQIVFYKRNGYMKAKANGRLLSDNETQSIIRQAQGAYNCASLDAPNDTGLTLMDQLANKEDNHDMNGFQGRLETAMAMSGISEIGQEILVSTTIGEETAIQVAERLGIPAWRVRTEKRKAILRARRHKDLFTAGIM